MANRLTKEKSPYLLQHANNPVDWYPWGAEAFEKAEAENKPIFLSIGYSTCHWCHVMEKESFEDDEVAGLMNDTFVSIKVDREERPDIDTIYMSVCTLMTGGGGYHVENTVRAWSLAWCIATGEEARDMNLGLGGVMLESTDWMGGFQDMELAVSEEQKQSVEPEIEKIIKILKNTVFPIHGI